MFAPAIIDAQVDRLRTEYAASLPMGLDPFPVDTCLSFARQLEKKWDPKHEVVTDALTFDEELFISHEQLRCKVDARYWLERYAKIVKGGQSLEPLFPLWQSQELFLARAARMEQEHADIGHPDGVLLDALKARQLGISSLIQALLAHRCTTHGHVRALIASDVPENAGSDGLFGMLELTAEQVPWWLSPRQAIHQRDRHIEWANGSRVVVEAGKSMKGALTGDGGKKGQIGRSKTYSVAHLSEISTWERPEQINDSLLPAIPTTPRTFCVRESTAKGRENYWHREWRKSCAGAGRFQPVFIGWYIESKKYWLPCPPDWTPTPETLGVAKVVAEDSPRWLGHAAPLTREQLFWYEYTRAGYEIDGRAQDFLEEYPTTDTEAFQYSGRSIFPLHVIERTRAMARPICDMWMVQSEVLLSLSKEKQDA